MADIEFRDGTHYVPDHLAAMMAGLDTYKMTLEEATRHANNRFLGDRLAREQDRVIKEHFRTNRLGER